MRPMQRTTTSYIDFKEEKFKQVLKQTDELVLKVTESSLTKEHKVELLKQMLNKLIGEL